MTQAARLQSLEKFRKGEVAFLLATDVAARGLDILGLQVGLWITKSGAAVALALLCSLLDVLRSATCMSFAAFSMRSAATAAALRMSATTHAVRALVQHDMLYCTCCAAQVVLNYDAPRNLETYLHRVGRTARAGSEGLAVSLVTDDERNLLKSVVKQGRVQLKQRVVPQQVRAVLCTVLGCPVVGLAVL